LEEAYDFFPFHETAKKCTTTALNSFTRFGLYLGIILAFLTTKMSYLLLGVGIAIVAAAAYHGMKTQGTLREGFKSPEEVKRFQEPVMVPPDDVADEVVDDVIGRKERTEPTAANPFMNVLLTEIGDMPQRPPAKNGEFLKRQFSNEFQDRLYGDPGDVFQKNQNQRTWAVQPITSVPNDQESFQNWLFRTPGRTCKEGNMSECKTATDGGTMTWLNQP
jgi:hypothetical protein